MTIRAVQWRCGTSVSAVSAARAGCHVGAALFRRALCVEPRVRAGELLATRTVVDSELSGTDASTRRSSCNLLARGRFIIGATAGFARLRSSYAQLVGAYTQTTDLAEGRSERRVSYCRATQGSSYRSLIPSLGSGVGTEGRMGAIPTQPVAARDTVVPSHPRSCWSLACDVRVGTAASRRARYGRGSRDRSRRGDPVRLFRRNVVLGWWTQLSREGSGSPITTSPVSPAQGFEPASCYEVAHRSSTGYRNGPPSRCGREGDDGFGTSLRPDTCRRSEGLLNVALGEGHCRAPRKERTPEGWPQPVDSRARLVGFPTPTGRQGARSC